MKSPSPAEIGFLIPRIGVEGGRGNMSFCDDLEEPPMLGTTFSATSHGLPEQYLRQCGSCCAGERESPGVDTALEFKMEVNEAVHGSSEVLPHNHGFSSDAQPQQQDSIDPTFRLADTEHQLALQHLQHRHQNETHHETPSSAIDQQSPSHPIQDKVKKKGSGQGPRLRKACDACSKRKVKVRSCACHLAGYLMSMPAVILNTLLLTRREPFLIPSRD